MLFIVGLGNPGLKYAAHRHNLGFMVVDDLARKLKVGEWGKEKGNLVAKAETDLLLVKPQRFMNNSGLAVRELLKFKQGQDFQLWVIHDDADLEFGQVKVKFGGTSGGHNGLNSLDQFLGPDYWRIRVGIGRGEQITDLADYVLQPFSEEEKKLLPTIIDQVTGKLLNYIEEGITQETFNATT